MKRPDLTGGVITGGVITMEVFVSEGFVSGGKPSKKSDFWLPFLVREVVNGVQVVHWMLSNAIPVMVGGVLDVVSRSWCNVAAALCRVYVQLSTEG